MLQSVRVSQAPRWYVFAAASFVAASATFCTPASTPMQSAAEPTPMASSDPGANKPREPSSPPPPVLASAAVSTAPAPASAAASAKLPPPKVAFPKTPVPIEPSHGAPSWAVFLVLGPTTPERQALAEAWGQAQKKITSGLGCHQGAGAPGEDEMFVAVYFKTEKDAKAFAAGTTPPPVRIAQLKTFCLD